LRCAALDSAAEVAPSGGQRQEEGFACRTYTNTHARQVTKQTNALRQFMFTFKI